MPPCDNASVDEVLIVRCGLVPYDEARRMQKRIEAAAPGRADP